MTSICSIASNPISYFAPACPSDGRVPSPAGKRGFGSWVHHVGCRVEVDALVFVDGAISDDERLDKVGGLRHRPANHGISDRCFAGLGIRRVATPGRGSSLSCWFVPSSSRISIVSRPAADVEYLL